MEELPCDLFKLVCRSAGVRELQPKLLAIGGSRLHSAWQSAVECLAVTACRSGPRGLRGDDIRIIGKYTGLRKLRLCRLTSGEVLAVQLVAAVAPALPLLASLSVERCYDFAVLRVLSSCGLASRLEELEVLEPRCTLSTADLWVLRDMRGLRSLKLAWSQLDESRHPADKVLAHFPGARRPRRCCGPGVAGCGLPMGAAGQAACSKQAPSVPPAADWQAAAATQCAHPYPPIYLPPCAPQAASRA